MDFPNISASLLPGWFQKPLKLGLAEGRDAEVPGCRARLSVLCPDGAEKRRGSLLESSAH